MSTDDESPRELNPSANTAEGQGSEIPLGWKPTPAHPLPVQRCVQIKKDGERCKRWSLRSYHKCARHAGPGAMKDGNVARYVEARNEAARLRMLDNADMAIDVLEQLTGPGSSEGIRLKSATEILDRAGIRGGFDIKVEGEITVNPSDEIAKRLAKLREGAEAVEEMKRKASAGEDMDDPDIIEGEVVPNEDDDDDEQETLF